MMANFPAALYKTLSTLRKLRNEEHCIPSANDRYKPKALHMKKK